jgi:AraC-like DNA-binding protein
MRSNTLKPMLRQCEDLASFLNAADDRFVRCADFLAWRRAPDLFGIDVWGDGSPTNLERRASALDHFTASGYRGQRLFFDNSICCDASPTTYRAAVEYWSSRRARHGAAVDKMAGVVGSGYVGALVAGLTMLLNVGYSVRMFQSVEAALAWLGEPDAHAFAAELQALRPSAQSERDVLTRLQQLLVEQDLSLEVGEAARRLGMSSRTLQRRLSTSNTTFQAELLRARLTRATTLMLTGKYTMTAIAFDLGFASPQHFSSRFSAIYGQPPSTWLRNYHATESGARRLGNRAPGALEDGACD